MVGGQGGKIMMPFIIATAIILAAAALDRVLR